MAPKKSKAGSKIIKRFAKQFGKGCGDFDIVNNNGTDHFLVPIDCDYIRLTLLHWLHYKTTKVPKHFKLTPIFLYSTDEPDPETVKYLNDFVQKYGLDIKYKKVDETCKDQISYNKILVDLALEYDCNKVALPDNLDYLNAVIITNMARNAKFDCYDVCQRIKLYDDKNEVILVRPFCYVDDEEIKAFAELKEFINKPTGFKLEEDQMIDISRQAINMLIDEYSNVRMNFFHSQFCVQKKYIGVGNGEVMSEEAAMD